MYLQFILRASWIGINADSGDPFLRDPPVHWITWQHFSWKLWNLTSFTKVTETITAVWSEHVPWGYGREVEVEVNLRPTVSRPVYLGVRRPSGTCDRFFFLNEISFRQLRVFYFVAPSLTRGRVCNLLYNCFWALSEQSLLGRSPAELTAILYCLIWDSPNLESQVSVFISPRNRVAQLYPRALGSLFVASYD
jgi:hypothetical protein